jgi:hypothetical protein
MPSANALIVLAEFSDGGMLLPDLAGEVIKPAEARRIGQAMLRDTLEKAHHSAGAEPLVGYFPPTRRGEVEDALGNLPVWAEPMAGTSAGHRASSLIRHLLEERVYRTAIVLWPSMAHVARGRIFDALHQLREPIEVVAGRAPDHSLGLVGLREKVPQWLAQVLDDERPTDALGRSGGRGPRVAWVEVPGAITTESELARAVFDIRAEMATGRTSGHDVPVHTLELVNALGFETELRRGDAVHFRRVGPPTLWGP